MKPVIFFNTKMCQKHIVNLAKELITRNPYILFWINDWFDDNNEDRLNILLNNY